jgi:hypothetical protein
MAGATNALRQAQTTRAQFLAANGWQLVAERQGDADAARARLDAALAEIGAALADWHHEAGRQYALVASPRSRQPFIGEIEQVANEAARVRERGVPSPAPVEHPLIPHEIEEAA